jgi:hypothetical protein
MQESVISISMNMTDWLESHIKRVGKGGRQTRRPGSTCRYLLVNGGMDSTTFLSISTASRESISIKVEMSFTLLFMAFI